MNELLNTATSHVNIILTFLLVFTVIYWLLMVIGLVDFESVDLDLDFEADIDGEIDIDVDSDINTPSVNAPTQLDGLGDGLVKDNVRRKWYHGPLAFYGVGTIPLTILLSILFVSMWIISIVLTQQFGIHTWPAGLISLIPTFIAGLAITKLFGLPLRPLFRKIKEGEAKQINFIGKTCEIEINADRNTLGQAIVLIDGDVLKISVKSTNEPIMKSEKAIIIEEIKEKNYYLIEKFENL